MSQRLCVNYEREDKYQSNSSSDSYQCQCKGKPSRMIEIESYVNVLIENNKNYSEEINLLRKENFLFRGELEVIMKDMLTLKENHSV